MTQTWWRALGALSLAGVLIAGPSEAQDAGSKGGKVSKVGKAGKAPAGKAPEGKAGASKPAPAAGKGAPAGKGGKGKKKRKRGSIAQNEPARRVASLPLLTAVISCPEDMVAVAGRFCIDRYESTLVEAATHEPLSPHYPPSQKLALWSFDRWTTAHDEAPEDSLARLMALPALPEFERQPFVMKAMSWPGNLPAGYVSGELAADACRQAGKRLCQETEWVTACRGQQQTDFPYGARYRQEGCNVFREDHPASILHGSASSHHTDPRLNLVDADGRALLRVTGGTPSCASRWGDDAIYDMVGNVDEWVDDPGGTFAGGFYSRATRSGCDARVRTHPYSYFDYSTGVRCCKAPD